MAGKILYGPAPTPLIFALKFLEKFELYQPEDLGIHDVEAQLNSDVALLRQLFVLALNLLEQAVTYSFTAATFPATDEGDGFWPAEYKTKYINPFDVAHRAIGFVNQLTRIWVCTRTGKAVPVGLQAMDFREPCTQLFQSSHWRLRLWRDKPRSLGECSIIETLASWGDYAPAPPLPSILTIPPTIENGSLSPPLGFVTTCAIRSGSTTP